MATSITEVGKGDFVKTTSGTIKKIESVYGVGSDGRLAKPSEGGIGVVVEGGATVSGWGVARYYKADEIGADGKPKD